MKCSVDSLLLLCLLVWGLPVDSVRLQRQQASKFKAFVINRDVDHERLATFAASARAANVTYERFPAVDKNALTLSALFNDPDVSAKVMERIRSDPRTKGSFACSLSHLRLWKRLESEPAGTSFLIFEDDSVLPKEFHARLSTALENAPSDWDVLYLNHNTLVGTKINTNWLKPKNNPGFGKNALLNAYVMTRAGAQRLLRFMSPITYTTCVDVRLRQHFDDFSAYFLVTPLVPTSGAPSVRVSK